MALSAKRGIEFCVDPAWRDLIGLVLPAIVGHSNVPTEDSFPGITAAMAQVQEKRKSGAGAGYDVVHIDYDRLKLADVPRRRSNDGA
jgi:hypothetical protein